MKFFFTGPVCPAGTSMPFRQRHRFLIFLMRVSCTYIVLMILSLQVLLANKGRGQNLDQINVTVGLQNQNLQTLFKEIQLQTGLTFAFNTKDVDNAPAVSLPRATRSVKSTLDMALVGTRLRYEQVNQNVIISSGNMDVATMEAPYAVQAFSIRGKITNSEGEGIPGVSVFVKGTTRGTTSDAEGVYTISAEGNDVLVFSSIGFKSVEVAVEARGVIDVGMEDDVSSLQEIVINAGYWDVKDKEKTGNISKVTAKEIQDQPISNPLAALQARAPGLQIIQQTGVPGGNFSVRIRGQNSIANGNDPLYIVDGVPYTSSSMAIGVTSQEILLTGTSPLNNINPSDIESIEILKDADATAIYGSRGANGVILITTKKGSQGKTRVNANFYTGIGKIASKINLLNTQQYTRMRKEAFANDQIETTTANASDILSWDTTRYTDWQDVLIGSTSQTLDAQLSISGGDASTQYIFGGGYHRETAVFPGNNSDQRISTHFNLTNTSLHKKLKTSISINYSTSFTDLLNIDLTSDALTLPPNAPALYDSTGRLNWENSTWTNPLSYLNRRYDATTNNLISNAIFTYEILPSLNVKTSFGYTLIGMKANSTTPKSSVDPAYYNYAVNSTAFSNSSFSNWIIEPQINWNKRILDGNLDILVGTTFLNQQSEKMSQIASGFVSESLMKEIGAASSISIPKSEYIKYRYSAAFGRLNYTFKNKYIINLTGRRDGSSRFGPDRQFANFGAVGLAWIFSNENFLKNNIHFLSFGKVRASYGITGNDQLTDYAFLDTYKPSGIYQGVNGLNPVRLYNPDFSWETNKKMEFALELSFLNDKISLGTSYYRNRSSNQLVGYTLPPTAGFTSILYNLPATIQNSGVEISITSNNINKGPFKWSTSLNFTIPRNKLIEYPNIETTSYNDKYSIGKPLNIRKLYTYLGIDQQTGLYSFQDINQDGSFNKADKTVIKTVGEIFYGGIQNSIKFRGFEADFLFQFVKQNGNNYLNIWPISPGGRSNQPLLISKHWQKSNDTDEIQRFGTTSLTQTTYSRLKESQNSVADASYIRLKNISLSYKLPSTWTERLRIENVKIFIQSQNLLTFTNYKGVDPENQSSALPPLKTLVIGIHTTL